MLTYLYVQHLMINKKTLFLLETTIMEAENALSFMEISRKRWCGWLKLKAYASTAPSRGNYVQIFMIIFDYLHQKCKSTCRRRQVPQKVARQGITSPLLLVRKQNG